MEAFSLFRRCWSFLYVALSRLARTLLSLRSLAVMFPVCYLLAKPLTASKITFSCLTRL